MFAPPFFDAEEFCASRGRHSGLTAANSAIACKMELFVREVPGAYGFSLSCRAENQPV